MAKEGFTSPLIENALHGLGHDSIGVSLTLSPSRVQLSRHSEDGTEKLVCEAVESSGQWDLRDADEQSLVTLLPLHTVHGLAVTMLGIDLEVRGTIYARERNDESNDFAGRGERANSTARRDVALVRDSEGTPTYVVRADGPTGLHVVDGSGNVIALCSTEPKSTTLDVLLLMKCASKDIAATFTALIVVQLVKAGRLQSVH